MDEKEKEKEKEKEATTRFKELASESINLSTGYFNLVISAGYVGAFALWSNVKDVLGTYKTSIVGLLLLTSLATFVSFEVYKFIKTAFAHLALIKKVEQLNSGADVVNILSQYERSRKQYNNGMYIAWLVCFSAAIITILGATCVMLTTFLLTLLN